MRLLLLTSLAVSVQAQSQPCSICGDGMTVGAPDAIISIPQQPDVACGLLELAGSLGQIPEAQCSFLPSLVDVDCACQGPSESPAVVSPTVAPVIVDLPSVAPIVVEPQPTSSPVPVTIPTTTSPVYSGDDDNAKMMLLVRLHLPWLATTAIGTLFGCC